MKKIIKDIVRQQMDYVAKSNKMQNKTFVRQFTYQQFIITEDEVGKR
ncbi:MAG: hypothetical protein R2739_08660 [Chitinophagales bacterium]|nr:hypothetical protein [Bacteroidota bacterium]